jgi:sugar lactone lactonase YvrE
MVGGNQLLAGLAIGVSIVTSGSAALAQESTPGAMEMPPLFPESCAVVAEGLNEPRYVAIGEDGSVYITEAGNGGDEVIGAPPAEEASASPEPAVGEGEGDEGPPPMRGNSGQITKIAPDGTQSVLVSGLPSYGGIGPVGIIAADGDLWVTVGGAAPSMAAEMGIELDSLQYENSVLRIDPASGEVTEVAHLGQYEVDNNPDGTDINPNLNGLALGPDGLLYVADAGGNAIYTVDRETGEFTLHTVVPFLTELTTGTPAADPAADRQPVPMAVAFDADGLLNVALLSEGWEGPNILRLEADGTWTGVASGLTMVFGLSAGADGNLYVSQGTLGFDETGVPQPGLVHRLEADGSLTAVVEGLFLPFGSAVDADGNVYVTVNAIAFGPGDPSGMLVRCDGAAAQG